ncbi:MAG: MerR family transcriptional regulator [Sphingobium sp.]|nr:MerR family transcriptional regulator [Sphingobium sp.]
MAGLTVSELARAGGVGVETVRYYQRQGLMPRPPQIGRSGAGIRHYGERDVHRLNFIRGAQAAGFSLKEIAQLLQLEESDDRAGVRRVARQRITALDMEITQLTRARDALERLAGQCERTKQGPCPVLSAFDPR